VPREKRLDAFVASSVTTIAHFAGKGGTTADFIMIVRAHTPRDLTTFFDDWLYSTRWANAVSAASKPGDLFAKYQPDRRR
jgi:hypothetical protein